MKLLVLIAIIFSMNAQAAAKRSTIQCGAEILTASKSGIKSTQINLTVKLDDEGSGEAVVDTSKYIATMFIQEDKDLKNLYYAQLEIEDKLAPPPNEYMRADMTTAFALIKPATYKYEKEPRLALMSSMIAEDNSGGQVLFTLGVTKKMYSVNQSITNAVVPVLSAGSAYSDAIKKLVKDGQIKVGDLIGLAVYDACK